MEIVVLIKILLLLVAAILASSCVTYGHREFSPRAERSGYDLHVVEIDDYGLFWNRAAVQKTLNSVEEIAHQENSVILLFVHGWHHNAKEGNRNFGDFQRTLAALSKKLREPLYRESRRQLGVDGDVRVIGIYVGWRGRSLPMPFNYFTFWGRKAAAERVGEGDFREFILHLQRIYESQSTGSERFTGLVTVGHSFGAQVLSKSVIGAIEDDLVRADKALSGVQSDASKAQAPVRGIGDLSVLINPALEAQQFERIHELYPKFSYNGCQTPALLVVSGEKDSARQFWFPVGRWVGRRFLPPPQDAERRRKWDTALGEYGPHITHRLEIATTPGGLSADDYADGSVASIDFTAPIKIGGALLEPDKGWRISNSPVLVAYSSEKLVQNHSGIFTKQFRNFLIDYAAFIEGKRMLLRANLRARNECPVPNIQDQSGISTYR